MHHPRLSLFSRALGMFPDDAVLPEAFLLTTSFLSSVLHVMERDKLSTRTTSLIYFQAYSQLSTIFVPVWYVIEGAKRAHRVEQTTADEVVSFIRTFCTDALRDETACTAAAAKNAVTKRATVLGANVEGATFVDLDALLDALCTVYETMVQRERAQIEHAFEKHNVHGDGFLTLVEFEAMLTETHDMTAHPISHEQSMALYQQLIATGDGVIQQADLVDMLRAHVQREKSMHMREEGDLQLELADHSTDGDDQLREIARGWDEVRMSTSATAPEEERIQHFFNHLDFVVRIQLRWRRILRSLRQGPQRQLAAQAHHLVL